MRGYDAQTHHDTMMFQVAWTVKQFPHCLNYVPKTRNSDIHFYDLIVDSLSSCYDELHSEMELNYSIFQTCDSLSKYSCICSNLHWSKNIMISTACLSTHWTAYIKMYHFQQVTILFHLNENKALLMWYDLHVTSDSKSGEYKDPSAWSLFMQFIPTWLKRQCHK